MCMCGVLLAVKSVSSKCLNSGPLFPDEPPFTLPQTCFFSHQWWNFRSPTYIAIAANLWETQCSSRAQKNQHILVVLFIYNTSLFRVFVFSKTRKTTRNSQHVLLKQENFLEEVTSAEALRCVKSGLCGTVCRMVDSVSSSSTKSLHCVETYL